MIRHRRGTRLRQIVPGLLLGLIGALALAGCDEAPPAPSQGVGTKLDAALPSAITHLRLVDSTGTPRTLAGFRGKVVVVQDTMTLCQETCPIDTAAFVRTARKVDQDGQGKHIVFLTVTVDPQRDTVAQLAAYQRLYHGPSNWYTLTGSVSAIDRLWKELGVYHKRVPQDDVVHNWRTGAKLTYDVEHSDEVFFFDRRGKERFILEGMPDADGKKGVPTRIYDFLSAEGRKNLRPGAGDWTTAQALDVAGWLLGHRLSS